MYPCYEKVLYTNTSLPMLIYLLESDPSDYRIAQKCNLTAGSSIEYYNKMDCKEFQHWHNSYEILYFTKKGPVMYVNDFLYIPEEGDILLVDSFDIHKNPENYPDSHYVFLIDPSLLSISAELPVFPSDPEGKWLRKNGENEFYRKAIADKLDHLIDTFKRNETDCNTYEILGTILLLFSQIQSYTCKEGKNSEFDSSHRMREKGILKKIYTYVASNYMKEISLDEISNLVGFTPSYLCKFIKRTTGQTFLEFLNTYRCHVARLKMDSRDLSITEIALDSGFSSVNYFSRVFRRTFGINPRAYRKGKIEI